MTNNRDHAAELNFQLEELEQRMMLSTVSLTAVGQEGSEVINVYVGNELVIDATVPTDGEAFEVSLDRDFTANDVRIEFVNDLYQPEQGLDRNVTIESFEVDGESFDFTSDDMFSSGTWLSQDGIVDGFGRGNTLHANGFFQYLGQDNVSFLNRQWDISGPGSSVQFNDAGDLTLTSVNGAVSVSSQFEVGSGVLAVLSVDAYRQLETFYTSDARPWSTIGVNFYNDSGAFVGQERIDIGLDQTNPATSFEEREFVTPDDATTAYVWAWIGDGPTNQLVVRDIQLTAVDLPDDSTPVNVELQPFSVTELTGSEINFGVDFTDDVRLGSVIAQPFRVTAPNGFNELAGVRTGLPGSTNQSQTLIYGLVKADGTDWSPADNGTYTIELLDNAVVDAAGNQTPGGFLGEFEIALVLPPVDTEAPGISIQPISDLTEPLAGPIEFAVYTTDNRDPIPFANNISVVNLGGSTRITAIAGGFDAANNRNWELYQIQPPIGDSWGAEDNGTYLIRLESGGLVDAAGNEAPGQLLGSFTVDIPVVLA